MFDDTTPLPISATAAENALKFARRHDWGENSWLANGRIYGLTDVRSNAQGATVQYINLPATISALREFGNY